jgi:hypothetical protein
MSRYLTITFGPETRNSTGSFDMNRYWNYVTIHQYQRLAESEGLRQMSIAGTFGYVVIKETDDEEWVIVDELGANNKVEIIKHHTGKYIVEPKMFNINELLAQY